MKKGKFQKAAIALILAIAAFLFLANYARAPKQAVNEFGEINFVYDGDTFRVRTETGKLKTVRLIGADSPEVQSPHRNEQCFGPEASKFAQENFLGKRVELIADPLTDNLDKYDRYLRHLELESGELISELLIKNGYATVYQPANFEQKNYFKTLEAEAKEDNLGLWQACAQN